jgi:uncharacterized circularly permuted ATP-grasp superfamily protein/uncharacterized alpha-E superfamily protein
MSEAAKSDIKVETVLRSLAPAGSYNELFAEDGSVRPHQKRIVEFLETSGPEELERLRRLVRQRITEQEVTFNILGVPEGTNRPWQLDLLPFVMDPKEWGSLEAGLSQRVRLLSAVHADLYGDQSLLRAGVIPPEFVLEHQGFHRSCFGWVPLGGHRIHLYAVDLGRDHTGRYTVYSDRTAAPAGAGYALENRLVLGRTLAGLFNGCSVERVRRFFEVLRRTVTELAPVGVEEPRVVLLSSGAQDESSFEHAYLARYLGYELVEGRDLTVRDRFVYLKTLAGLRKIDVVLRRVYDSYCDPIDLREDSFIGVPGLVGAAAAGNVGLANPLGVSLLESAAMKAYLQPACRFLFGEDLHLDSVETYWCGDAMAMGHVLPRVSDFIFKPAFEDRKGEPFIPAEMSVSERAAFVEQLKARPRKWVAERWPGLSCAPVLEGEGLRYGGVALRTFLCRDGDDYLMMPGGLARINTAPDGLFLSIRGERTSKDIWVSSGRQPSNRPPPGMPDRRVDLRRGGLDMPSRLLDDIYWLGRYVERADMTARLLRSGFECLGSEAGADADLALHAILGAMRQLEMLPKVSATAPTPPLQGILTGALLDSSATSLRSICERIHQLTVGVRSRLSRDAWHVLKRLTAPFQAGAAGAERSPALAVELCVEVLVTLSSISGTTQENMVRGHAWAFLDMGRRVERGAMTLGVIRALLPAGASRVHMEALLEIGDSLLTYRARYLSSLQVAPVVDLVLTDDTNPRSFLFQVNALRSHVERLPQPEQVVRSRAERRIIELQSNLMTADIVNACAGNGTGLRQLLDDCNVLIWQFSDDMTRTWFSHAKESRGVTVPQWVNEELEAQ